MISKIPHERAAACSVLAHFISQFPPNKVFLASGRGWTPPLQSARPPQMDSFQIHS